MTIHAYGSEVRSRIAEKKRGQEKISRADIFGGRLLDNKDEAAHSHGIIHSNVPKKKPLGEHLFKEAYPEIITIYSFLLNVMGLEDAQKYMSQKIIQALVENESIQQLEQPNGSLQFSLAPGELDFLKEHCEGNIAINELEQGYFLSQYKGIVDFGFIDDQQFKLNEIRANLAQQLSNKILTPANIDLLNNCFKEHGFYSLAIISTEKGVQLEGLNKAENEAFAAALGNDSTPTALLEALGSAYGAKFTHIRAPEPRILARQGFHFANNMEISYYSLKRDALLQACQVALHEIETLIKSTYAPNWSPGKDISTHKQQEKLQVLAELYDTIDEEKQKVSALFGDDFAKIGNRKQLKLSTGSILRAISATEENTTVAEHKGFFARILSFFKNIFSNNSHMDKIKAIKDHFQQTNHVSHNEKDDDYEDDDSDGEHQGFSH